ncbi:MAG: hypothetical protein M1826_003370 [Phylliscum demangeonii]|nr:MAG: hypothetical protein M1826_003370 [Phylliscum demangeonii]
MALADTLLRPSPRTSKDDPESGYDSGESSRASMPDVCWTPRHLQFINERLQQLEPEDILRWCITTLPGLYQSTAFGLTGLATLDMLSRLPAPYDQARVDLIFFDTLHHFPETLALVDRVRRRYPGAKLHVYRPQGLETADQFAHEHGRQLWTTNDERYDWLAKVEPAERAYADLHVRALLTGRRRSQGGQRGDLPIVEVDEAGRIKVNPLANWTFQQVRQYVREHDVPYNDLLDRGYKSVGDWHSTQPVKENEDERSGRWKGQEKTECGIHNPKSAYAQYLREQERIKEEQALQRPLQQGLTVGA